ALPGRSRDLQDRAQCLRSGGKLLSVGAPRVSGAWAPAAERRRHQRHPRHAAVSLLPMTSQGLNRLLLLVTALTAGATVAGCQIEPGAAGQPTYEADVRPILMARCIRCHGSPPLGDPTHLMGQFPGPPLPTIRFDVYGDTPCADADAGATCVVH